MSQFHVNGLFGLDWVKQMNDQSFDFSPNCNGLSWYMFVVLFQDYLYIIRPALCDIIVLRLTLWAKPFIAGCRLFWKAISHWLLSRILTRIRKEGLSWFTTPAEIGRMIKYGGLDRTREQSWTFVTVLTGIGFENLCQMWSRRRGNLGLRAN